MAEKFAVRENMRKIERQNKKDKKNKKGGEEATSRRTNTSSKVFKNLDKIVKEDYAKKDAKRAAKASGKGSIVATGATADSAKRFKM